MIAFVSEKPNTDLGGQTIYAATAKCITKQAKGRQLN